MNGDKQTTILLFDFDSTFVTVEALDELANIVLLDAPDREERVAAITVITNQGMTGEIGFADSLAQRFEQLQPTRAQLDELVEVLKANISPSFIENKAFIQHHADTIWVVSGGFKDFIVPVVAAFGISADHVLANEFIWASDGSRAIDYDRSNHLSQNGGKIKAVKALNLPNDAHKVMVGDGMTDYAIRGVGLVNEFVAFTETVARKPVVEVADRVANSLDFAIYLGYD